MWQVDALGRRHDEIASMTGAVLDYALDDELQALVEEAAATTGMPMALVSIVLERSQFFRAHRGLPVELAAARATARDVSFCQLTVRDGAPLEITHAATDERVPQALVSRFGVQSYLGHPVTVGGSIVGSLCVIGTEARSFSDDERRMMDRLATRVSARLDALATRVSDGNSALLDDLRRSSEMLDLVTKQLQLTRRLTQSASWEMDVATGKVSWAGDVFGDRASSTTVSFADVASTYPPESWSRLSAAVQRCISTGEGYSITVTRVVPGGEPRTVVTCGEALRNPAGAIEKLVGTFQDTTERERAASRTNALAERLQLATSAAKMGVWDWDLATNAMIWDEPMRQLYELPDLGAKYKDWREVIHPEDRHGVEAALSDGVAGRAAFDVDFRIFTRSAVKHVRCAATLHADALGKPLRMVGVAWDITAQRVAERARLDAEAMQRAILEHAGPAIIATDRDGIITLFNPAAEALLGWKAKELVGTATPERFHDAAEIAARKVVVEKELSMRMSSALEVLFSKSRRRGPDANEWSYVRKDGSHVAVLVTVSSIRDVDGKNIGYLAVAVEPKPR